MFLVLVVQWLSLYFLIFAGHCWFVGERFSEQDSELNSWAAQRGESWASDERNLRGSYLFFVGAVIFACYTAFGHSQRPCN